jgi:hypothetical protein
MPRKTKLTDNFPIKNLTEEQFAWLAGLFQGESYLYFDNRTRTESSPDVYTPPP